MKFQNHIGLDIGQSAIKIVQLSKENAGFKLEAIGIAQSPVVEIESEKDSATAEVLKKLIKDSGVNMHDCVVGLPESQVFTRVIEMPFLEEPDLTSAIRWQAEQYVPIPLSDVVIKHQVLTLPEPGVPNAKMTVLLVAAPNDLMNRYLSILSMAKLEPLAVETEIFAVARALVASDEFSPASLLVNFGNEATTLAVLKRGDLALTQPITVGGLAFTRALTTDLKLAQNEAEEYKKTYGLLPEKMEGKVKSSLQPIVDMVVSEIKKAIAFYESKPGAAPIKRIVLSGGTALIPGLVTFFAEALEIETQLGNPFSLINLTDKQRETVFDAGPIFAAAVGLAMK